MEGGILSNWLMILIAITLLLAVFRCVWLSSELDEGSKITTLTLSQEQPTHYCYGVASMQGRRAYMEDRYTAQANLNNIPNASLFAVFDGHGGHQAAQFCVDRMGELLLADANFPRDPVTALTAAFERTDAEFLAYARTFRPPLDDGCTAIAVLIIGDNAYVANAGDSRAILVKKNGTFEPLSEDHKPNRPDEWQRIKKAGGTVFFHGVWRVKGILAVSRAIGDRMLKPVVTATPEIRDKVIGPADKWIVVASDGLWDVFSPVEVAQVMSRSKDHHEAAHTLTKEAWSRGSSDNITVLVVDVSRQRAAASSAERPPIVSPAKAASASQATLPATPVRNGLERTDTTPSLAAQSGSNMPPRHVARSSAFASMADQVRVPAAGKEGKASSTKVMYTTEGTIAGYPSPHVKLKDVSASDADSSPAAGAPTGEAEERFSIPETTTVKLASVEEFMNSTASLVAHVAHPASNATTAKSSVTLPTSVEREIQIPTIDGDSGAGVAINRRRHLVDKEEA